MSADKKSSVGKDTPLKSASKKVVSKSSSSKRVGKKKAESELELKAGIDWRSLYLYAVSLVTLLVVLFSTVSLLNAIVNYAFPDPIYIDPYAKVENAPNPSLVKQQEINMHRQALKSIFNAFTTMLIATPVYLYHWREARKSSKSL